MNIAERVQLTSELRDVKQRHKKLVRGRPTIIAPPWFVPYDGSKGYPVRFGNKITPLICGKEVFDKIYDEISDAKFNVHIALWSMMPGFRLIRGADARGLEDLDTIGDLLIDAAKKGVQVRVLLWGIYHAGSVMRTAALMAKAKDDPYYRDDWDWFNKVKEEEIENIELRFEGTEQLLASHHQKTVVVDNKIGFCLGMNMRSADWDSNDNRLFNPLRDPGVYPRHDIGARIEGPCVKDLELNFAERWARSGRQFDGWTVVRLGRYPLPVPITKAKSTSANQDEDQKFIADIKDLQIPPIPGETTAQIVRTRKVKQENSIHQIYRQAIANANHYIYM